MSKVVYEGWMVRHGRRKIGRSFIHMRYFILENRLLSYYKKKPKDNVIFEAHNKVAEKTEIYVPYNILPLDPDSANQEIMRYPEIQAAVRALRNTVDLPWPMDYRAKKDENILDWLQATFGFQKDNVANQREHLILLLVNVHTRRNTMPSDQQPPQLDARALDQVFKKLFKNYEEWCKYLGRIHSLRLPTIQGQVE